MSQLPPENSDSQQPDADPKQQADSSIPQNVVQGNQNRVVQGNNNQAVIGDGNTIFNNEIAINTINNNVYQAVIYNQPAQQNQRFLELQLSAVTSELDRTLLEFSEAKNAELQEIIELGHRGQRKSAYARVVELRKGDNWNRFTKSLQAKIFRMLAGYAILIDKNGDQAKALANEAHNIDPETDDTYIRTLISYQTEGAKTTLTKISTTNNIYIFNLRLGLLLEEGRFDDVINEIQTIPESIQPNAETYRLHALTLLCQGNIHSATHKIQEAIAISPDWESVREYEAIINYFSAISPVILQPSTFPHPEPVDSSFLKRDAESLQRLRKAEAEFAKLILETEREDELYQYRQEWRLACLANDPERQPEAEAFCQTLLQHNPIQTRVIIWAIARNYQINLLSCKNALEKSIEESENNFEQITVLIWLYLNEDKNQQALALLEQKKSFFEQQGLTNYWILWHAQILVANGNYLEALQEANTLNNTPASRQVHTLILRQIAKQSNDWQSVVEYLETCFQESQNAWFLYECCRLKADLKDWTYIADRADMLVESVGTLAALDLAVNCLWNAERPRKCLQLLNDNQQLFPEGVLPGYLRHLKILCLANTPLIIQALTEAEALFKEQRQIEYLLTWIDLQLRLGDMKGLVISARELAAHKDVQPINLLKAANWVYLENKKLAQKLWKQATEKPIDENLLDLVIDLSFKLNLEKEARSYIQQAQLLALEGKGPFKAVDIRELLKLSQNRYNQVTDISKKYDNGELPTHAVAEAGKIPLLKLLHEQLQKNAFASNPHFQAPVFIRHGGRFIQLLPFSEEFIGLSSQWRLHIDISAFLLAAHLDILDAVEQYFQPLKISAALQMSLVHQRRMLFSYQASHFETNSQILEHIKSRKLREIQPDNNITELGELAEIKGKEWASLLEKVKAEGGYLVEFLPLSKINNEGESYPIALSDSAKTHLINCRSLVEALKCNNLLGEEQYQEVLRDLGNQAYLDPLAPIPQLNTPVIFINSTIEPLIKNKVFSKICQHFKIFIEHNYLKQIQLELETHEKQCLKLDQWLSEQIERVRDGLEQGIYEIVTLPDNENEEGFKQEDNLDLLTVVDLLTFTANPNDVLWIDDRCINKFPHREGAFIITILDVLDALLAGKQLNLDDYYEKILILRKANVRYIPVTGQEIIHFLKQAQVIDGEVKETEELSVIRRYLASCLLDNHRLQILPATPENFYNSQNEFNFILICFRATEDAIVAGWQDKDLSEDHAVAYANWIVTNLYTGTFGTLHFSSLSNPENNRYNFIALDISGLYIRGIELLEATDIQEQEKFTRRQKYFNWIDQRIAKTRFRVNPEVAKITGHVLHTAIIENSMKPQEDEIQNIVNKLIINEFYKDLPKIVSSDIESDVSLIKWLGYTFVESININSFVFTESEFWLTVEKALNEGEAFIEAKKPLIKCKIQKILLNESSQIILEITSEDNSLKQAIDDPLFLLLSNNKNLSKQILQQHRVWFDCGNETFEQFTNEIISLENARERFRIAEAFRDDSVARFYAILENKLENNNSFSADDLIPPSTDGLLRYFRLDNLITDNRNFLIQLSSATESLLNSNGLKETLNRLCCLPVKLPHILIDSLGNISAEQRQSLLENLTEHWTSPISKLHLIDLALHFSDDGSRITDLAKRILDELCSEEGEVHFYIFQTILHLVNNEFSHWNETKKWTVPTRLAMLWAHTSKLYNILVLNKEVESLKTFAQKLEKYCWSRQLNADTLNHDLEFWNDILHPNRLTREEFVVNGLAAITVDKPVELLECLGMLDKAVTFAVRVKEEQLVPDLRLLRDPMLANDCLGSLLRSDRQQSRLLGTELRQYLASSHLKTITENAIATLEENQLSKESWLWLIIVVDTLPIYDDLREKIKHIIETLDVSSLLATDIDLVFLAFKVASSQIIYMGDEQLESCLEDKVIYLANLLALQNKETNLDKQHIHKFLEIVFRLANIPGNPNKTSLTIGKLLKKTLGVCPRLANTDLYLIMSRFVNELPIQQLTGLWEVVLYLRAIREQEQ
ncbi:hypothetical protein [Nostoc sp. PA-18-2419]|uniref:HTH domain-containing protein n=1 Tax=Nostoc sp. PA-18-2419 TaxID=2575443 RepID=UPI001109BA78|nr:hypothetical protein [Nostoc sp. PA-18-2419]